MSVPIEPLGIDIFVLPLDFSLFPLSTLVSDLISNFTSSYFKSRLRSGAFGLFFKFKGICESGRGGSRSASSSQSAFGNSPSPCIPLTC